MSAPNATPLAALSKASREALTVILGECRAYMSGGPSYYAIESIQRAAEKFKARLEEIEAAAKAAPGDDEAARLYGLAPTNHNTAGGRS